MLTRCRRGQDLPLLNKTNERGQLLPCGTADTKLPSPAHHLHHSTQPKTHPAFSKDSSDEEESSEEEADAIQKHLACSLMDEALKSKRTPSDNDQSSDGSLFAYQHIVHSAGESKVQAASVEDSSSGEEELCPVNLRCSIIQDKKQGETKKQVSFEKNLEVESESESSREAHSPAPARCGNESDKEVYINLIYMKSIVRAYPKLLQPLWSYRTSLDKLKEFMNMTHQEKWAV